MTCLHCGGTGKTPWCGHIGQGGHWGPCPECRPDEAAEQVELQVEDDGIGFDADTSLNLDSMIKEKHFGLAGLHERASLIGAQIRIDSNPGKGSQVRILWEMKQSM